MTVVVEGNQDFDRNAKVAFDKVRIDVGMEEWVVFFDKKECHILELVIFVQVIGDRDRKDICECWRIR
jgi:hypothetical protein